MGMTLKEMLRKGASEGTVNADEVRALAQECGLDTESLYTILEERGIKIQENEASLDVDSILAEVESAEASANDDYDEPEEDRLEENPADLKAAMDELLDDPVKNYLKQIGQIPLLSAEQEVELSRRIHAGAEAASGAEPPHPCRRGGGPHPAGRPAQVQPPRLHQAQYRPLLL